MAESTVSHIKGMFGEHVSSVKRNNVEPCLCMEGKVIVYANPIETHKDSFIIASGVKPTGKEEILILCIILRSI
jgi:hypothetical protein